MTPASVHPQMVVVQRCLFPRPRMAGLKDPRVVRLTGEVIRHGTYEIPYHAVIDQVIRPGLDPKGNRAHPPIDIGDYEPLIHWPQQLRAYADMLRAELSDVEKALATANALTMEVTS